jgi:cytochrome c-type biogenesis protein CcmH
MALLLVLGAGAWIAWPLLSPKPAANGDALEPRSLPAGIAVLLALPLLAGGLYVISSNYEWDPQASDPHGGSATDAQAAELAALTKQLAERLEREPGDVEGWRMLARTQLMTQDAPGAVATLERAQATDAANAVPLRLDFAEALILTDVPANVERAKGLLEAELATDPANAKALWYSGVLAIRVNDRDGAVAAWQQMAAQPDLPPQARQLVEQQLGALGITPATPAAAQGSATAPATATPPAAPPPAALADANAASGRTLRIAVSVAPELAARIRPEAVLFVAAREKGIPGPPLAARRLAAGQLPTTIVLSDADAVMAGRNLSSVGEVQVTARVAFGGTATTVSGDLLGSVEHRPGDPTDLAVTIDSVAP